MKKIAFIIVSILFIFNHCFVFAEEKGKEAGQSAIISYKITLQDQNKAVFYKKYAIKNILEKYQSPLINSVDSFIDACFTYQLDCYLLPAISGLESTFGRYILPNSYNPFGWGGGRIIFKNWDESINSVGLGLKNNYLNRGLITVESIGSVYSESPTWAIRVRFFINQFKKEEENLRLYFEKNEVKL